MRGVGAETRFTFFSSPTSSEKLWGLQPKQEIGARSQAGPRKFPGLGSFREPRARGRKASRSRPPICFNTPTHEHAEVVHVRPDSATTRKMLQIGLMELGAKPNACRGLLNCFGAGFSKSGVQCRAWTTHLRNVSPTSVIPLLGMFNGIV